VDRSVPPQQEPDKQLLPQLKNTVFPLIVLQERLNEVCALRLGQLRCRVQPSGPKQSFVLLLHSSTQTAALPCLK
jgi:hypothetical protein